MDKAEAIDALCRIGDGDLKSLMPLSVDVDVLKYILDYPHPDRAAWALEFHFVAKRVRDETGKIIGLEEKKRKGGCSSVGRATPGE